MLFFWYFLLFFVILFSFCCAVRPHAFERPAAVPASGLPLQASPKRSPAASFAQAVSRFKLRPAVSRCPRILVLLWRRHALDAFWRLGAPSASFFLCCLGMQINVNRDGSSGCHTKTEIPAFFQAFPEFQLLRIFPKKYG